MYSGDTFAHFSLTRTLITNFNFKVVNKVQILTKTIIKTAAVNYSLQLVKKVFQVFSITAYEKPQ